METCDLNDELGNLNNLNENLKIKEFDEKNSQRALWEICYLGQLDTSNTSDELGNLNDLNDLNDLNNYLNDLNENLKIEEIDEKDSQTPVMSWEKIIDLDDLNDILSSTVCPQQCDLTDLNVTSTTSTRIWK